MISTARLRQAMHAIAARKGEFTLFGLFKRSNAPFGVWDLVVAAPWLEAGKLESTRELVGLLSKSIGKQALRDFARVVTVDNDDPTVKFILATVPVDDGEARLKNTDLFGLQMDEAVIFRAQQPRENQRAV